MAEQTVFQPARVPFAFDGIDVLHPPDRMPPGKCPNEQNVRSVLEGSITSRPGYGAPLNATPFDQPNCHSVRRMNNSLPGASPTYRRFVGAGSKLYSVDAGLIDSGYSGNPLSMVVWRPDQSVEPWLYVGDSQRMRKCRMNGSTQTNYGVGIAPPTVQPGIQLSQPKYTIVDDFADSDPAGAGWTTSGTASSLIQQARSGDATTFSVQYLVYDSGSSGWASFVPEGAGGPTDDNFAWIGVGARIVVASETVVIQEAHTKVSNSTILGIVYDSGTTGLCTIQAATPLAGLTRNSLVLLNTEAVRILSASEGPDGLYSFRCSTTGAHAVAETIYGLSSFRCFFTSPHSVGDAVSATGFQFDVGTGIGQIALPIALDLSQVGGRPMSPEDYLHISVWINSPAGLTEGRLLLNVDASDTSFDANYYYFPFQPSYNSAALSGSETSVQALTNAVQNVLIGEVDAAVPSPAFINATNPQLGAAVPDVLVPNSQQIFSGSSTWTEIMIPYSSLQRVGGDATRSIANVNAIGLWFNANADIIVEVSAWWVGGGYGPDTVPATAQPLCYRYRYRSSLTGAKSLQSPGTRTTLVVNPDGTINGTSSGVLAYRQEVQAWATLSADPQVDLIDFERFGGVLNEWHYIGTIPNSGTPVFYDDYSDDDIKTAPALETDVVQPFVSFDVPRSGTCNVVGTRVTWASGDMFSTSWSPGQEILINGIPYIVYGQPKSSTVLETVENIDVLMGVPFIVAEPTLIGQPLPCIIGPFDQGNFLLAWGDPRNPGTIYATKGNDPDSAPIQYYLELSTPSEPIVGGVIWDNNAVVFSTKRAWRIEIDANAVATGQGNALVKVELQVGHGLFAPWAICSGPVIWFLGEDGVPYQTDGSPAVSIVEDDLRPLFPHDGGPGVAAGPLTPPDLTQVNQLRFSYVDSMVRFDYKDTNSTQRTLIYNPRRKAWRPWIYTVPMNFGYWEEGESLASELLLGQDGNVYQVGGYSDNGTAIIGLISAPILNVGNPRTTKNWGDEWLDLNPNGATTVQATLLFNFGSHSQTFAAVASGLNARTSVPLDVAAGLGYLAQNAQMSLIWSESATAPTIYEWQAWWSEKAEQTIQRATNWDDAGFAGVKWIQGVILRGDTSNAVKTIQILGDGGIVQATISVQMNGETEIPYSFDAPFPAHLLKILPTDTNPWLLYDVRWIYEPLPESATTWITQGQSFGRRGWIHIRDGYLPVWSDAAAVVTLTPFVDGVSLAPFSFTVVGNRYQKIRLDFPPNKGLLMSWELTCPQGVRIFKKDMEIRVKEWGSAGPYAVVRPFGDVDGETGARI